MPCRARRYTKWPISNQCRVDCFTFAVVQRRSDETINPKIATGEVEVLAREIRVLNEAKTPPFQIADETPVSEDVRLKYRYLDLRRSRLQHNVGLRHRVAMAVRRYFDAHGFWEIETPILAKSTPEGARDFLVPVRLQPGHWYALPQSPQLFKQLLMVAGVERYFQIARCFRDEDFRADRQPEFSQLDVEMSFCSAEDVQTLIEELIERQLGCHYSGCNSVKCYTCRAGKGFVGGLVIWWPRHQERDNALR